MPFTILPPADLFLSNSLFFCPLQLVRRKNPSTGRKEKKKEKKETEERLDVAFNSGAAVADARACFHAAARLN